MTISYWRRTATLPAPALVAEAPRSCDALVIGAGICGVSMALQLERRGLRVAIVDREGVAAGASGRNAGFLMRGCADNYAVACRVYGRERARELWRLTERNLEGLRAEGIEQVPSVRRVPSCLLAFDEVERDELRQSVDLLREDGFESDWIDGEDGARRAIDDVWTRGRPLGGLLNPHDGAANSVDLLHFLVSRVRAPMTRADVLGLDADDNGVRVRTSAGTTECAHAFVCANAYAPTLLPATRAVVAPKRGQMLALRPKSPGAARTLTMSYYANRGYEYFRQPGAGMPGGDGTIVFGGSRRAFAATEVGYDDTTTPEVQNSLEGFIARFLGLSQGDYEVTDRWSGVMGFTSDGLPKIVPIPPTGGAGAAVETRRDRENPGRDRENQSRDREGAVFPDVAPARAWFIGGFTGHGMSMAYETTRLALATILDNAPNPFR